MVICPIARAVHCTGCAIVNICPAKTFLGDYGKENKEVATDGDSKPAAKAESKPAEPKRD